LKKNLFKSLVDFPVSDEDKRYLNQSIKLEKYKKDESVFRQGEICPKVYFIGTGLVKLSYLTLEGKEYIKSFISENEMFGSLQSQLSGGGSSFSAIAMEELELEVLDFSIMKELIERYPALQKLLLGFFQQLALKKEIREYEFLCLSAQQRYENFCLNYPEMSARIKQSELALYLGITPIALSRLKHRK